MFSDHSEQTSHRPVVLLAAGGTGGHLFPAEALAEVLTRRGITVDLATDHRAERYGSKFPARQVHIIASETLRGRDPISLGRAAARLGLGLIQALRVLGRIKPAAIVGFGGYPTIPPVAAGTLRNIPTLIHEQNAVIGRANRLLAARVTAIATSFAAVLEELASLRAWVSVDVVAAPDREYVTARIELLIEKMRRLHDETGGDVTVFIG